MLVTLCLVLLSGNPMCVAPAVIHQEGWDGAAWAADPAKPVVEATAPAATGVGLNLWQTLIPLIVPIAIAGLKMGVSFVPPWLLPILAPILGGLADAGLAYATGSTTNPMVGMLLGSAGVGLREIVDQLRRPKVA
jgi:hypothetical protein